MMIYKILDILKNDTYCKLEPSKVHGVGVFAIKDIPKGINPFAEVKFTEDVLVEHESLKGLDESVKKMVYSLYFNDEDGVYIQMRDGKPVTPNRMDFHYYVNHSNNPNVKWDKDCYCYKSVRIIEKNEELLLNYGEYSDRV